MKLNLQNAAKRLASLKAKLLKKRRAWYKWAVEHEYSFKRRVFNAQRIQRHPATLSASRRRKLRRT